jgi:hypothetical protein
MSKGEVMKLIKKIGIIFGICLLVSAVSCASKNKVIPLEEETKDANKIQYGKDWIKKGSKNVDATFGSIRLRAKKNIGTFNIAIIDEFGKTIPCFSTSNEYITTSFYLKSGKRIIKLNEDSCVDTACRKIENGMQVLYSIEKLADVFITFQCVCPNPSYKGFDSVKITAHVENTGSKKADFQLKAVFDTILGETDRHHFYDSKDAPVKNEVQYNKKSDSLWFTSKNANASMQFVFSGKGVSPVEMLALANYSTLDTKYWEPDMLSYRAFDTVLAYNNSAVGVIWKSKKIAPENSADDVFYICTALGKDEPQGKYIFGEGDKDNPPDVADNTKSSDEKLNDKTSKPDTTAKPQEKTDKPQEPKEDSSSVQKPSETVTDYSQKKPEYSKEDIQKLLDKIAALEDDGENVDRAEIERLNKQLDEILKSYRK